MASLAPKTPLARLGRTRPAMRTRALRSGAERSRCSLRDARSLAGRPACGTRSGPKRSRCSLRRLRSLGWAGQGRPCASRALRSGAEAVTAWGTVGWQEQDRHAVEPRGGADLLGGALHGAGRGHGANGAHPRRDGRDLPPTTPARWEPLVTVVGSDGRFAATLDGNGAPAAVAGAAIQSVAPRQSLPTTSRELAVARFLVADRHNPSSIASCVLTARENLRTTRDTVPRDGWHALNDLYLYVASEADRSVDRRIRERFLVRVDRRQPAPRRRAGHGDDPRRGLRHVAARAGHRAGRHDHPGARRAGRRGARRCAAMAMARRRRRPRRGAVDGRAAVAVRAADVPARRARTDRGPDGRAVPARARPVPAGRAGAAARDPPRPGRAARPWSPASTPSTTSTPCCATRRRPAPTAPPSTTRWTPCSCAIAAARPSGSPSATCASGRDRRALGQMRGGGPAGAARPRPRGRSPAARPRPTG